MNSSDATRTLVKRTKDPMMLEEDCAATITADEDEAIEVDIESCP